MFGVYVGSEELVGLRISAVLLICLGCFFCLFDVGAALMLAQALVQTCRSQAAGLDSVARSLLLLLVAVGLTCLCFKAAAAITERRRWAAYVAMGFGVLLLLFTASFVYDWFHPERQSPDEGFGVFIVPVFLATGLWWLLYLNLPRVRAEFRARRSVHLGGLRAGGKERLEESAGPDY